MPTTTGLTIPFTGLRKQYNNLRQEILDVTDEVLRSGQLMNGNYTAEFESWLSKRNNQKYALTCHSGTHALEIIAEYYKKELDIDHPVALIPTVTYAATANAFIRAGWDIHLVDVDSYGLLDVRKIADVGYDAVVLVGLYGAAVTHLGSARTWEQWLYKGTVIIEDGAQHWLSADSARVGRATAISFDPMKNLNAYGNGGALTTDIPDVYYFAQEWRDNAKPNHHTAGTNSRMSEIDCAQMLVKTKYIDQWQARRRKIAEYWCERLHNTGIRSLIDEHNSYNHAFHKFVIFTEGRDILQRNLALRKIETKIHYKNPLHEIGMYTQYPGPGMLATGSSMCRGILSLPIYPELTDLEVEYIIDSVIDHA